MEDNSAYQINTISQKEHQYILEKRNREEERKRFNLKRKYFLRKYTHRFLSLDIYQRFEDFFIVQTLTSFTDIDMFNENIHIFLDNIKSQKLHPTLQMPLLELELAKNITYLNSNDRENLYTIDYITIKEYESLGISKSKEKILAKLLNEYLIAEAIKYVLMILEDNNLRENILIETIDEVSKYILDNSNHGFYARTTWKLLKDVQESSINEVAFFTDLDFENKEIVINNTVAIFEEMDNVVLDNTLLKDLGINHANYSDTLLDNFAQNIQTKLFENTSYISAFDTDILALNFNIDSNESAQYLLSKKNVNSYKTASLYHFTKGVLNGLPYMIFIEIFMAQKSSKKQRILKNLDNYTSKAKPSYQRDLKIFRLLIEENSHKNILLIVSIAYELSLSKTEAWNLSEELGLNNKASFRKFYPIFYELLYPNFRYIKKNMETVSDELKIGIDF